MSIFTVWFIWIVGFTVSVIGVAIYSAYREGRCGSSLDGDDWIQALIMSAGWPGLVVVFVCMALRKPWVALGAYVSRREKRKS